MGDLFDAAAMYDEDYLYFFAAPGDSIEFAAHGPAVPGAGSSGAAAAELAWRLRPDDLRPPRQERLVRFIRLAHSPHARRIRSPGHRRQRCSGAGLLGAGVEHLTALPLLTGS